MFIYIVNIDCFGACHPSARCDMFNRCVCKSGFSGNGTFCEGKSVIWLLLDMLARTEYGACFPTFGCVM